MHISLKPEVVERYDDYEKKMLDDSPQECGLKIGDNVYLFSHEIPKKEWRDCTFKEFLKKQGHKIVLNFDHNADYQRARNHSEVMKVFNGILQKFVAEVMSDDKYIILHYGGGNGWDDDQRVEGYLYKIITVNGLNDKIRNEGRYINDNKTLKQLGIELGTIVTPDMMQIFVKTLTGRTLVFDMCAFQTIMMTKRQLDAAEGVIFSPSA